jgi:hypothetical protein
MLALVRTHTATQTGQKYQTPDDAAGAEFEVVKNTSKGLTVKTTDSESFIPWDKFGRTVEALREVGYGKSEVIGASFDYRKRKGISEAVEPEKADTVHTQYILPILERFGGLIKIHGESRPNKVEIIGRIGAVSDSEPRDPTRRLFIQVPAFLAFVVALWWSYKVGITSISGESSLEHQAQFGDMFGGLNALISMMGFVGLFVSLNLQRKQFQASLADMRDNAEAAKEEARAIKAQTLALEKSNGFAEAQNFINARQLHISNLSAQLKGQLALHDLWVRKKNGSAVSADQTVIFEREGEEIRSKIANLTEKLSQIDTSQVITRFPY